MFRLLARVCLVAEEASVYVAGRRTLSPNSDNKPVWRCLSVPLCCVYTHVSIKMAQQLNKVFDVGNANNNQPDKVYQANRIFCDNILESNGQKKKQNSGRLAGERRVVIKAVFVICGQKQSLRWWTRN